jgi:hypothetical protein
VKQFVVCVVLLILYCRFSFLLLHAFHPQTSESLEDGDGAPAAMVSRAEATRTYSIIGGSVGGFFVLVLVMSYWRRRNLEIQQELDSEWY